MKTTTVRPVALALLVGAAVAGCSSHSSSPAAVTSSLPTQSSTSSAPVSSPAAESGSPTTAGGATAETAPAEEVSADEVSAGEAPVDAALQAQAEAYGLATSQARYADVATLSCPGMLRGLSVKEYADALAGSPRQDLTFDGVSEPAPSSQDVAELGSPGVDVDDEAWVSYRASGDGQPNPTVVARFVHAPSGWLYCGALPNG